MSSEAATRRRVQRPYVKANQAPIGATISVISDAVVRAELACQSCGYNLRSSPTNGRCSECGDEVSHSLMVHEQSIPRDATQLCLAIAMQSVAMTLLTAATIAGIAWAVFRSPKVDLFYVRWLAPLASLIGMIWLDRRRESHFVALGVSWVRFIPRPRGARHQLALLGCALIALCCASAFAFGLNYYLLAPAIPAFLLLLISVDRLLPVYRMLQRISNGVSAVESGREGFLTLAGRLRCAGDAMIYAAVLLAVLPLYPLLLALYQASMWVLCLWLCFWAFALAAEVMLCVRLYLVLRRSRKP